MVRKRRGSLGAKGQGMLEYAVAIVLVAVLVLVMVSLLGTSTGNLFSNIVYTI